MAGQGVYVKDWSESDRGLYASQDVSAGSLIFKIQQPLVTILDEVNLQHTCSGCLKPKHDADWQGIYEDGPQELKTCGGCQKLKFCNKTCQTRAWKRFHKYECKMVRELEPMFLKTPRCILQLHQRRLAGGIPDDEWNELTRLKTHASDIRRLFEASPPAFKQQFEMIAMTVFKYSKGQVSPDAAMDMAFQLAINSHTLVNPMFDSIGTVMDPFAAVANHSCDPNAIIVMDGPEMSFRSLKDIKKDEQIFQSYIPTSQSRKERKDYLFSRYHFECHCPRCEAEEHTDITHSQLVDHALDTELPPRLVAKADKYLKGSSMGMGETASYGTQKDTRRMRLCGLSNHYQRTLKELPKAVTELQKFVAEMRDLHIFRPHQYTYAEARNELISALIDAGMWVEAFKHGVRRYLDIDPMHYPSRFHPLRTVHSYVQATLTLMLAPEPGKFDVDAEVRTLLDLGIDPPTLSLRLLIETLEVVHQSHGETSSFSRMVEAKAADAREVYSSVLGKAGWAKAVQVFRSQDAPLRRVADMV